MFDVNKLVEAYLNESLELAENQKELSDIIKEVSLLCIKCIDNEGKLIQESVIGQPIKINSQTSVTFSEFITTTGLQIKTDSGIPLVYFSFFLLMVSVYISFISYSQIWQVEALTNLVVGGKSNRAVLYFQEELKRLVQKPKN